MTNYLIQPLMIGMVMRETAKIDTRNQLGRHGSGEQYAVALDELRTSWEMMLCDFSHGDSSYRKARDDVHKGGLT
jgi:hypothetical protein